MPKTVPVREFRTHLADLLDDLATGDLVPLDQVRDEHAARGRSSWRGRLTGLRSYRVGVYRIIDELRDDKTVRVVAVRHRGSVYDTDPR